MSNSVLLHQLQVLERNRKSSSGGNNLGTNKRRRRDEDADLISTTTTSTLPFGLMVNKGAPASTKSSKASSKDKADEKEQVRARRFEAALEQLAAHDGKSTQGRAKRRKTKDGRQAAPQKADALLAAARRAAERQQADRTKTNLKQLTTTDEAVQVARPLVKAVVTLSGRSDKKRKERKWHILKEDKPRPLED